jgi:hypothetical protein
MARARLVIADTSSEEIDQMRRTMHGILHMLESAEASLTAGASAEDVLNAFADAVRTGTDDNPESIANIVPSERELVGVRPQPLHPRRRGPADHVAMATTDDY